MLLAISTPFATSPRLNGHGGDDAIERSMRRPVGVRNCVLRRPLELTEARLVLEDDGGAEVVHLPHLASLITELPQPVENGKDVGTCEPWQVALDNEDHASTVLREVEDGNAGSPYIFGSTSLGFDCTMSSRLELTPTLR